MYALSGTYASDITYIIYLDYTIDRIYQTNIIQHH